MAKIPTGRFVWFEYSSADAKKAQGFYGELFGWKTKEMAGGEAPYTMIAVATRRSVVTGRRRRRGRRSTRSGSRTSRWRMRRRARPR